MLTSMRRWVSVLLSLAAIPLGWPHHVALGLSDSPGDGQKLHQRVPLDVRYQYLSGGVNTGSGWATWNPDGTFASMYVRESIAAHMIPVFSYYQLLQSKPAVGSDELQKDLSNLRNPATMQAYWADFSLLLHRVSAASRNHLVVIHIEPDLWGYLEQAHAVALARAFAHHLIALRNRLAPHVALAWHLSVWGTGEDPTYSKPSLAHMDALAARSAAFYRSLHAHFNLVFTDITDRDAGFYQVIEGNPNTWWGPANFRRENAYIAGFTRRTHEPVVLWQLPLGNTFLNNTWGQFRDNRVQWWLGAGGRAHLRATRNAGVIGLLFGGGAAGTTSAQTDGGLFYRLARSVHEASAGAGLRRGVAGPGRCGRWPSVSASAGDGGRLGAIAGLEWWMSTPISAAAVGRGVSSTLLVHSTPRLGTRRGVGAPCIIETPLVAKNRADRGLVPVARVLLLGKGRVRVRSRHPRPPKSWVARQHRRQARAVSY